jgi:hypothetical protein
MPATGSIPYRLANYSAILAYALPFPFFVGILSLFNDCTKPSTMPYKPYFLSCSVAVFLLLLFSFIPFTEKWQSSLVQQQADHTLLYHADAQGNQLPDFSRVGYYQGNRALPVVPVVKTVSPPATGNSDQLLQQAIDEVAQRTPDANGFRGAILLKKGSYNIAGTIRLHTGGIVLRGEGMDTAGTRLIAAGKGQRTLIEVSGTGHITAQPGRVRITDSYVPVGAFSFHVSDASALKTGDAVIVYRPGTDKWIEDLHMNRIVERKGTRQWQAAEYNFQFERTITKIRGNEVFIDNPIVLAMEPQYGGGELFRYSFEGRISQAGIEHLYCESEYAGDTDEDHGWDAITIDKAENCWVKEVRSRYFGYSCVNLHSEARYVTVTHCECLDAKSQITGSRRYSFNNDGQLNLFLYCHATEGRHDYVTGAKVCGPNVFYHCTARRAHADIGPHHRWAMGTLYDNIATDGEINVQDRGNMGSGHGWAGVNQVVWHCRAAKAAVQTPWANGQNYCIGLQGAKDAGHFKDRPDGVWEGLNKPGLEPASLYMAQMQARKQALLQ